MATRYQSVDEARGHQQESFSGPALSIVSSNIEGLTCAKQDLFAELCTRNNCDILCLQETHRGPSRNRPRIPGMTLITERLHDQYGSAIFVRNGLTVDNASVSENDNIEVLSIELMGISVSSVYKPPIETFCLPNAVTDGRVNTLSAKDGDLRLSASNACLPKTEISVFVTECVFFTSTCYKLHMFTLHDVLYS